MFAVETPSSSNRPFNGFTWFVMPSFVFFSALMTVPSAFGSIDDIVGAFASGSPMPQPTSARPAVLTSGSYPQVRPAKPIRGCVMSCSQLSCDPRSWFA